jgi:hypothetical protein
MDHEEQEYYEHNDEYYSDDEDYLNDIIDDDSDAEAAYYDNPYIPIIPRPSIQWSSLKLGMSIIEVSSYGTVKPYRSLQNSTEGSHLEGTPYQYYTVEVSPSKFHNYYIHELVWTAFYGPPTNEYMITHKPEYTKNANKIYSNCLHNITLLPKIEIQPLKIYNLI